MKHVHISILSYVGILISEKTKIKNLHNISFSIFSFQYVNRFSF